MSKIPSDVVKDAASISMNGQNFEEFTRPFLKLAHRLTGLESTYLTEIHWDNDEQEIKYADNRGAIEMTEGLLFPWEDTLCRQALAQDKPYTDKATVDFPDSQAAKDMGINTFVSVPVMSSGDNRVIGTLCALDTKSVKLSEAAVETMQVLARLIGDRWVLDKKHHEALRRAVNAERKISDRAMFLAQAEHKLKSPLTIIVGWTHLLDGNWPNMTDDARSTAITTIADAADALVSQIDQMLSEARNEALAGAIDLQSVDICAIVQKVAVQMDAVSPIHSVTSNSRKVGGLCARADGQALWQVLVRLVENSISSSPKGAEIELTARFENEFAIIEVDDNSTAIPEGTDIFATDAKGESSKGVGLSLHIAKTLVKAMRGEISAVQNERGGTTVTVKLPTDDTVLDI